MLEDEAAAAEGANEGAEAADEAKSLKGLRSYVLLTGSLDAEADAEADAGIEEAMRG